MKIIANGIEEQISDGLSILAFLEEKRINTATIVIERNEEIVKRDTWQNIELCEGDRLEIVSFVGGG